MIACALVRAEPTEIGEGGVSGALPRFALCGRRYQAFLEALVEPVEDIPFEDRLLGFVVPCLSAQIAQFHETGGPELADLYSAEALSRLDSHLAKRLHDFAERVIQILGTPRAAR